MPKSGKTGLPLTGIFFFAKILSNEPSCDIQLGREPSLGSNFRLRGILYALNFLSLFFRLPSLSQLMTHPPHQSISVVRIGSTPAQSRATSFEALLTFIPDTTNKNRSPKGNMWSAIPVALLCMIVNWSERKQGSGPEGDEVL